LLVQLCFYPAYAFNPSTCAYDIWMGNMTVAAAGKRGFRIDANYSGYADEKIAVDGVAFINPRVPLVAFWTFESAIFEIFIGLDHADEFHLNRALSTLDHGLPH
jgi:hypothetical protein